MIITTLFLCVALISICKVQSDCTQLDSCTGCILSEEKCIWCSSESKCQPFVTTQLTSIFCSDQSVLSSISQCPYQTTTIDSGKDKLQEMLDLLHKVKMKQVEVVPNTILQNDIENVNVKKETSSDIPSLTGATTTSSEDLKELLHKLLLLKLLRKVKNEGSATLTDEDKKLLSELSVTISTTTTTTTTTTTKQPITAPNVNNELSQLIEILKNEAEQKEKQVTNEITNEIKMHTNATVPQAVTKLVPTKSPVTMSSVPKTTKKLLKMTLNIHEEIGGVDYVDLKPEKINIMHKSNNVTSHPEVIITHYCVLYEDSVLCNKDNNCTWCNSAEECIHRNDKAFDVCVHTKRIGYDIDPCFSSKHCKQCVQDEKCYWCDVSKSCHTYPFFGYVPNACGGDWYVKQCDVQLAVIIIVLPLIMILLAMVTFYFCLKYCYYRKKVLRVPLFEKPGVFDYRKDKKVYFVHPDDEESDNELEAEKLRKKYRLPAERAPLIDPNS